MSSDMERVLSVEAQSRCPRMATATDPLTKVQDSGHNGHFLPLLRCCPRARSTARNAALPSDPLSEGFLLGTVPA